MDPRSTSLRAGFRQAQDDIGGERVSSCDLMDGVDNFGWGGYYDCLVLDGCLNCLLFGDIYAHKAEYCVSDDEAG